MSYYSHEDLERMIVRRLDGELSEEESLALDRELIRNPDARSLLEEFEHADRLASAALSAVLGGRADSFDAAALPDQHLSPVASSTHRGWWLGVGVAAAAALAFSVARLPMHDTSSEMTQRTIPIVNTPIVSNPLQPGPETGFMRNVSAAAPSIRRNTGREIISVMGDDGNIYLIEVDRSRTVRRPGRSAGRRSARDEM